MSLYNFHVRLDTFQMNQGSPQTKLDTIPSKPDAFEIELHAFQIKTSVYLVTG